MRLRPVSGAGQAARTVTALMAARAREAVRWLLATPPGRRLRQAVTSAAWMARGAALRVPPLPPAPRSVLFVCKGNICRSPFAAALAAPLLARHGIRCSSAGFLASPRNAPPADAVGAAANQGIVLSGHRPAPLTNAMMCASDVVVVMEYAHLVRLRREYPAYRNRIVLLPRFAPPTPRLGWYERYNIADPFGKPRRVFDDCYARTRAAVLALVDALSPGDGPRRSPTS